MHIHQRNNVTVLGSGRPIVFAHGFGCDQTMWRFLAPEFAKTHQVILYDLVGSGASDLSAYDRDKYGSLHGHADDLAEVIAATTKEPAIFVGHSVSAMIGVLASNKAPSLFAGQLMVGPSACYINDEGYHGGFARSDIDDLLDTMDGNYLGWSSAMAPKIMGAPDDPALGQELTNSFCRTDPEIAKHFARVTFLSDHRADLAHSRVPTLILQCSDDIIAPLSVGEFIQRQIPGSEMVIIDNNGHCPHLSAPLASVAAMRQFIAAKL